MYVPSYNVFATPFCYTTALLVLKPLIAKSNKNFSHFSFKSYSFHLIKNIWFPRKKGI